MGVGVVMGNYNGVNAAVLTGLMRRNRSIATVSAGPSMVRGLAGVCSIVNIYNGNTSDSILDRTGTRGRSLVVSATSSSRVGVLYYFLTGHVKARGAMTHIEGPRCGSGDLTFLHRRLRVSLVVGPRLVTTRRLFGILGLPDTCGVRPFSIEGFRVMRFEVGRGSILSNLGLVSLEDAFGTGFLIYTMGHKRRTCVPHNGFALVRKSEINVANTPGRVVRFFDRVNVGHASIGGIVVLNKDGATICLTGGLYRVKGDIAVVSGSHRGYRRVYIRIPGTIIMGNSNSSRRLLVRRNVRSTSTIMDLANLSRLGVLVSSCTTSGGIPGIVAGVGHRRLVPLTRR